MSGPPLQIFPPGWQPPQNFTLATYPEPNIEQLFREHGARTPEQWTQHYRSLITKAQGSIQRLERAKALAELFGESTVKHQEWIEAMRSRIRDARNAIRFIGQRPTVGGTRTAMVGAGAAVGSGTMIAGATQLGWGARAGRAAATLVRVVTLKGLAIVATALVVGGGAYVISKSLTGDGETQGIAFIGPAPDDQCTVDLAEGNGLVWSEETGWDLGGTERPDPEMSKYSDDAPGYRADRDAYVSTVNGLVYETFREAQTACEDGGLAVWPVPAPEDMCGFLPAGIPVVGQPAITEGSASRQCVAAESIPDGGTPIWVEVVVPEGETVADAENWMWGSSTMLGLGGMRVDLEVGDETVRFEESDRHVVLGRVGPVGFALFAATSGGRAGDLDGHAKHIADAYITWADAQG